MVPDILKLYVLLLLLGTALLTSCFSLANVQSASPLEHLPQCLSALQNRSREVLTPTLKTAPGLKTPLCGFHIFSYGSSPLSDLILLYDILQFL